MLGKMDYCHSYRLKKHKGGMGVAFRHRESRLKNFWLNYVYLSDGPRIESGFRINFGEYIVISYSPD